MTYFLTVQDFDNKFIHKNKPLKSLDDALAMISPRYLPLSEGKLTSLAHRPLSDPQAAFARGPGEGPLMAEGSQCSQTLSNVRSGSPSDYRHRHPESPHLGVQPTKSGRKQMGWMAPAPGI